MVSLHHAYHFTGFYDHVPTQSTSTLKKLYGQLGSTAENHLNFLAYYYNRAVAWNADVVATYKDGFNNRGEVFDFERGGPADIQNPYWLTDDSISSSSWCYTVGIGYYSLTAMLHALIDRVSKNGTMLLNIAPMADGTIPSGQRSVLLGIGDYLTRFGESIYATRAWAVYGEGPTKMGGGSFTTPVAGTNTDIRFTRDKANTVLYATVLGWPGNTFHVASGSVLKQWNYDGSTNLQWQLVDAGNGYYRIVNRTNGMVADSWGDTANGANARQAAWNGGDNQQWRLTSLGNGRYQIVNRGTGTALDGAGNSTVGSTVVLWAPNASTNNQWTITAV